MHFARSVKLVQLLGEQEEMIVLCEYHVMEYLPQMEQLLVEQVLTAFATNGEREAVLSSAGLGYLIEQMHAVEKEWEEAY